MISDINNALHHEYDRTYSSSYIHYIDVVERLLCLCLCQEIVDEYECNHRGVVTAKVMRREIPYLIGKLSNSILYQCSVVNIIFLKHELDGYLKFEEFFNYLRILNGMKLGTVTNLNILMTKEELIAFAKRTDELCKLSETNVK